jgi:hypothetical protein
MRQVTGGQRMRSWPLSLIVGPILVIVGLIFIWAGQLS